MKAEKTVKTKRMVEIEGDYTFTVITCNTCGDELNDVNGWGFHDREADHVCSLCGNGHWCHRHLVNIELDEASPYNDWEPNYLRLCPACVQHHKGTLDAMKSLRDQIEKLEAKRLTFRDTLEKLRKDVT